MNEKSIALIGRKSVIGKEDVVDDLIYRDIDFPLGKLHESYKQQGFKISPLHSIYQALSLTKKKVNLILYYDLQTPLTNEFDDKVEDEYKKTLSGLRDVESSSNFQKEYRQNLNLIRLLRAEDSVNKRTPIISEAISSFNIDAIKQAGANAIIEQIRANDDYLINVINKLIK